MFKAKLISPLLDKSPKRGRRKTPHFLEIPRSDSKLTLTLRSFREAREQCKLAHQRYDASDTQLQSRLATLEASLKELKLTSRSLSRENTSISPVRKGILKSPVRTKSAGRTLYTPSNTLIQLATVAKSLLALPEDTEEGRTNIRQLRTLQISKSTKSDKEREETQERNRQSVRLIPSISPVRKAPAGRLCRTRIQSLKCLQKTLEETDVVPETGYLTTS